MNFDNQRKGLKSVKFDIQRKGVKSVNFKNPRKGINLFLKKICFRKEKSDKERSSSNPMVDLFYGQFRAEGVHEGTSTDRQKKDL